MKIFEKIFGTNDHVFEESKLETEDLSDEDIEELIIMCRECGDEYIENEIDYDSGLCYSCLSDLKDKYDNDFKSCPDCNGTGYAYIGKQCETCGGQGEV